MKKINKSTTLACFSPPVMIATFVIEIGLVLTLLYRRKHNRVVQLTVLLILFLSVFQLAEYGVCEKVGFHGDAWARIGFASITILPPLGMHLMYVIAQRKSRLLVPATYLAAMAWIVIFLFFNIMEDQVCQGNYVIFHINDPIESYYYWFYNIALGVAMIMGLLFQTTAKSKKTKSALFYMVVGYLSFIVPSVIVRIIATFNENGSSALPSIMCGFAVVLALILVFKVIPNTTQPNKNRKK